MNVAQTIIDQIKAMDRMALMAWGARGFVGGKVDGDNDGVMFKVNGTKTKRGSKIMVVLNEGKDLYEVKLFHIYKMTVKYDATETDVYAEDLVEIIDSMVG